jgi:hypothetical protein
MYRRRTARAEHLEPHLANEMIDLAVAAFLLEKSGLDEAQY